MRIEGSTRVILKMYFGLVQGRSIRKATLRDELVHRGVSPYGVAEMVERVLEQIGDAADNRIEEVDAQLDKDEAEMMEARFYYDFRLSECEEERCYDCTSLDIGFGTRGRCTLLNIAIANYKKSRCPKWKKDGEMDP